MEIKKGIAVSPGIAIAKALVIDSEDYRIPRRTVMTSQKQTEIKRVRLAFKNAITELNTLEAAQADVKESNIKDIFAVHLRFLRDKTLRKKITDLIENELYTAEYAVSSTLRDIAVHFSRIKDPYISERAADIYDIERRLLKHLLGKKREEVSSIAEEVVVVAHELSPTQTAGFDKSFVRGMATDAGGRTSHTAIVARSLGIPAVVALEDVTANIHGGDTVIIDGNRGVVIINPDEETILQHEQYAMEFSRLEHELDAIKDLPSVTRDGVKIELLGNIEFPDEAEVVTKKGGQGIGLYRTEFLYLYSETEPTEDDHYQAYAQTIKTLGRKPVIIRTLDLGADKYTQSKRFSPETNPQLGLRSIRFCLQNLMMFKTQLRAILRASVLGDVRLMFPLITSLQELRQAKMILRDVMEDLDEYGVEYNPNIPIGMMVETPAAALMATTFAREVSFFSIGTNDLIQYTLACDRNNPRVKKWYDPYHPAVLISIKKVADAAARAGKPVSLCGEMAGEPVNAVLLMGLGIRSFSLSAPNIPQVKEAIRRISLERAQRIAHKVLGMESAEEIGLYLAAVKKELGL